MSSFKRLFDVPVGSKTRGAISKITVKICSTNYVLRRDIFFKKKNKQKEKQNHKKKNINIKLNN